MTSLMLVEDHAVLAEILTRFLEKQTEWTVVATTDSADAALEQLPQLAVDLVLIDVSLPGMSGSELAATLAEQFPALPCLMVSGHDEAHYIRSALAAGARGYVKKEQPDTLLDAVSHVLAGEIYLSEELRQKLSD